MLKGGCRWFICIRFWLFCLVKFVILMLGLFLVSGSRLCGVCLKKLIFFDISVVIVVIVLGIEV